MTTSTNYHQLLVTLFSPRNDTVLGQMNLTPITMPHVAAPDGRGAGSPVASDPATAAGGLGGAAASKGSTYDSKGAAYYVCVVIVVYAFAIASFVLSVARRRRGGGRHDYKYRLPSDDVISDGRKRRRRRTGVCWSRVRGADDIIGWTQWLSTSEEVEEEGSSPSHTPNGVTVIKEVVTARDLDAGEVDVQPDEFITLVQVLPFGDEAENCAVAIDSSSSSRERTAREEIWDFADRDVSRENEPRCCWSMGPDGNIWIIQVHEEDNCRKDRRSLSLTANQSKSSFSVSLSNAAGLRSSQGDPHNGLISLTLSLQSSADRGSEFDQQRHRVRGEQPPSDEDRQRRNSNETVEEYPTDNARETIGTYLNWSAPLANVRATTPEQYGVTIRKENPRKDSDVYTLVCMPKVTPKVTSPSFVPRLIHVTSV